MRQLRPAKRTKIVATIGPASDDEATLKSLIMAGVDVFRFNFSHSSTKYIAPIIILIRKLSVELNVPVAILGDLRGPRIRVGKVENGTIELVEGNQVTLTPQSQLGTPDCISVSYPELRQDVYPGCRILLDDGDIELVVEAIEANGNISTQVIEGGTLSDNRGVNLPGLPVGLPSITKKDFGDVDFAITQGFDFLALSFVQSAEDVHHLRQYMLENGADIPIIAKIERKSALEDIEAIAKESYGVMVARGDLALEMSIQDVPIAQKQIIAICRQLAVPVITATQMLESMIHSHKPTRAEATDVANAILDGTDALMLSAETAIGEYPVETIETMADIAMSTEKAWFNQKLLGPPPLDAPKEIEPTVAYASYLTAKRLSARAIITYTASGATTRRVACHRPAIPILALSAYMETRRRLALSWGVETSLTAKINNTDHMVVVALQHTQFQGVAGPGDTIVMIAGTPPYGESGRTNTLKVERLPEVEQTDIVNEVDND